MIMGTKRTEVKAAPAKTGVRRFRVAVERAVTVRLRSVIEIDLINNEAVELDRNGAIARAVDAQLAQEAASKIERQWNTGPLNNFDGRGKIQIRWGLIEEI